METASSSATSASASAVGRRGPQQLSDQDYIEESGFGSLLKFLVLGLLRQKPDDPTQFAISFCKKVESCHHVLGMDYSSICSSSYNRRAFVYSLMKAFQGIPLEEEVSPGEFQHLIEMLCADFSKQVINESILSIGELSSSFTPKYAFGKIRTSFFFHFLFDDWIHMIESFFVSEGKLNHLSIASLRTKVYYLQKTLPQSISQPPQYVIDDTLERLKKCTPNGSEELEITSMIFFRELIRSNDLKYEVSRIPSSAEPLLSSLKRPVSL